MQSGGKQTECYLNIVSLQLKGHLYNIAIRPSLMHQAKRWARRNEKLICMQLIFTC